MKRTDVQFSLAFSTAMSQVATEASKEGKPDGTIKKLVVLSLKAGSAFVAGSGITPEIETLVADPELVALAKEEDPSIADVVELLEKTFIPKTPIKTFGDLADTMGCQISA